MVLSICITPPLAFNQVLNGLVSQAIGSGNPDMAGIWLQQSMFWLSVTILPCLTGLFYVTPILEMLEFPSDIAQVAGAYAKYNLLWPLPNGWYQCMRFYFQSRGLPRPAMYNNLLFLGINALLNWFFVFGGPTPWKGLGFIGAAVSLSISRTMQGVCYYFYMFVYKKHHIGAWPQGGWSLAHHTKERTYEFMKQSLPNIGTLLFQAFASQATTVLVGRLGELSIAASSALSTVIIPWSGTLSATCCTVSGVRVGYHLGRGDSVAAKRASWLVMYFITLVNLIMAVIFLVPYFKDKIMDIATDDQSVVALAETLVPAMLVGTYLNLLVSNGTSGVFSGQGRPLIATILSFGLELPLSIGGVAIYILVFHGDLLGVYWFNAISGAVEAVIVLYLIMSSNWSKCAENARDRQEASQRTAAGPDENNNNNHSNNQEQEEDGALSTGNTDPETSSDENEENNEEDALLTGDTDQR
jgi:multidrug resistance protein, MATE family